MEVQTHVCVAFCCVLYSWKALICSGESGCFCQLSWALHQQTDGYQGAMHITHTHNVNKILLNWHFFQCPDNETKTKPDPDSMLVPFGFCLKVILYIKEYYRNGTLVLIDTHYWLLIISPVVFTQNKSLSINDCGQVYMLDTTAVCPVWWRSDMIKCTSMHTK